MRVLIVSKAFVVGSYRVKLEALARLGVDVIGMAPPSWKEGGGEQRLEAVSANGYKMLVSPLRFNGHFHLHHYPWLNQILTEVQPDLLHLDEEPYNLATLLGIRSARRMEIPAIFFSWQNIPQRYPPPFRYMEAWVYRNASLAIAGTAAVERVLRSKGYRGPLAVVPQFGVDTERFRPRPRGEGNFHVGFLNRLIPGKAPLLVLEAFAGLSDDARLVIVGDGPQRTEVEREVTRMRLSERVSIRQRVPSADVPALMRGLDVILLPSITTPRWKEQFGRVLIEAMASGIPVIGSDSGEIPAVLGDAGLIVPEGDASALTSALTRIQMDATLRDDLGRRGRARAVSLFSNERVARQTLEAYESALHAWNFGNRRSTGHTST